MDLGLRGRIVIVAAASGGLGRAIAEEFAAEGATTVIAARNEARLAKAVEEIAHATGNAPIAYPADCTVEADNRRFGARHGGQARPARRHGLQLGRTEDPRRSTR